MQKWQRKSRGDERWQMSQNFQGDEGESPMAKKGEFVIQVEQRKVLDSFIALFGARSASIKQKKNRPVLISGSCSAKAQLGILLREEVYLLP